MGDVFVVVVLYGFGYFVLGGGFGCGVELF